ncbi:MAG: hypothetical protein ACK5B9_05980 [Flavobacteriia bacterium]|jgi:hypothetical protein
MENQILFSEKQKFTQWWLFLLLFGISGLFIYALYIQLVVGTPFGDKPIGNGGLIAISIFVLNLNALFFATRLETQIDHKGIYVRFYPFQRKMRFYAWQEIQKAEVRTYKPLQEYGGWGIRYGFRGNGKAYNVSGNEGLQLELKSGEKFLIGTRKGEELNLVIEKLTQNP